MKIVYLLLLGKYWNSMMLHLSWLHYMYCHCKLCNFDKHKSENQQIYINEYSPGFYAMKCRKISEKFCTFMFYVYDIL